MHGGKNFYRSTQVGSNTHAFYRSTQVGSNTRSAISFARLFLPLLYDSNSPFDPCFDMGHLMGLVQIDTHHHA